MATRRSRQSRSLAIKSMELALSVPQVIAHRTARMAIAGPNLSGRDLKEFELMVSEKYAAFAQAWNNMAVHAFRANQALALSTFNFFCSVFLVPLTSKWPSVATASAQSQNAVIGLLNKGLAPIHRKAVLNARRLAKTGRR